MMNKKSGLSGKIRKLSREDMKKIMGGEDPPKCPLNCGTGCGGDTGCACKGSPNTYCATA
jgi:hypothetical protein